MGGVQARVTNAMNRKLVGPVSMGEVRSALFQIDPSSAPGPDGMTAAFFQTYWDVVGFDITSAISSFMHSRKFLKGMNHTHLVMIPKVQCPTNMTQLRPISLCNVAYKILAKVLANRLSHILPSVISPNQSAFVAGRVITDNIIIGQEIFHFLKNQRYGRKHNVAIKLDMSKAYDRVEWIFLELIMAKMGFCQRWISWMKECMASVSYSFLLDGQATWYIKPTRGLRQGDPLSPFLFLICSEGLSAMMQKGELDQSIKGVKICRNGPAISHLFFADDTLIFCEASSQKLENVRRILEVYGKASGQLINYGKSCCFFSKNTPVDKRDSLSNILGIRRDVNLGNYLGLPTDLSHTRYKVFSYIKERLRGRTEGWSEFFINQAGKEVLLKSVALALPSYAMSCIKLPVKLCNDLNAMMAKFWWGSKGGEKKIYWLSWDKLSEKKQYGGLGFRDLRCFNLAMLAKQGWRLIKGGDSLMRQILKAKYFPHSSFMRASDCANASWTWKSILEGRKILEGGVRWRIGKGDRVKAATDPWIPRTNGFKPRIIADFAKDFHVSEFINRCSSSWKEDLVRQAFNQEDAEHILGIPLPRYDMEDSLIWNFSNVGNYSVKSGYETALDLQKNGFLGTKAQGESSTRDRMKEVWKSIWELPCQGKIKNFIWKCLHNIAPVNDVLVNRRIASDVLCPVCKSDRESVFHLLVQCPFAQVIWRISPLGLAVGLNQVDSLIRWWDSLLERWKGIKENKKIWAAVGTIIWRIWLCRNDIVFNSKKWGPDVACQLVVSDAVDFLEANANKAQDSTGSSSSCSNSAHRWEKPCRGWFKINFDGGLDHRQKVGGLGIVIRDCNGSFRAARAIHIRNFMEPLGIEAMAARESLVFALELGLQRFVLEGDCYLREKKQNQLTSLFL